MTAPLCIDCIKEGITTYRKPVIKNGKPVPGKRCATHQRARRSQTRDASWERRLMAVYGITAEEYWLIYEAQGRCCAICRRANGTGRRKLSVDHCHETGHVRGLLCGPCNRDVVGHLRDDPEAFDRGAFYLRHPPAVMLLGKRIAPIELVNLNEGGDEAA